ncbi:MAG: hypothetical protein IJ660_05765 [Alphaproteobacteria bacterium]|nr:hypothetical protein [Alphaproteobacteria bacterium]
MSTHLLETTAIEELINHNHFYREKLVARVQENFPETTGDVSDWSAEDFDSWFQLLVEYPFFWQGKQKALIGLLWSLDNAGKLQQKEKVIQLCTHLNMVDFAADARNSSVVGALSALIGKYGTLSQAEQFQNRVDLAINEKS